jgi:hypothetical protein
VGTFLAITNASNFFPHPATGCAAQAIPNDWLLNPIGMPLLYMASKLLIYLPEHLPHSQDLSVFASLNTSWQSGQNRSFIVYKDKEPLGYNHIIILKTVAFLVLSSRSSLLL